MRTMTAISTRVAVLAVALAAPALVGADPVAGQTSRTAGTASETTIQVSGTPSAAPVPAAIIGANGRWPKDELGGWQADTGSPDPTLATLARRTRLAVVRYPGGTVANLFRWRNAIGPQAQRSCQIGGGFVGGAEPYDSVYGPDEQQRFVSDIGARTLMMTPEVESSAANAADFVEYMNARLGTNPGGATPWAAVRARNGHAAPYGVTWWEIGNEPAHAKERYWRSSDDATALRQYVFGGTQPQTAQPVGTPCDHRPAAGVSTGAANQHFTVWYPPVVPRSQTVRVGGVVWQPTSDLAAAGPADHVYSFDPATGAIRFGDGVHGAVPAKGEAIDTDYVSGRHPGFVDFYRAMKAVDPDIKVCSSWATPEFVELMGRTHPYDCLAPHLYASPDVSGTTAQVHSRLIPDVATTTDQLTALRAAEQTYGPPGHPAAIEVGEYGTIVKKGRSAPTGWTGSLSWSLYAAGVIDGMIENDVRIASISNLNNATPTVGALFGGAPRFFLTARAKLLGLYSHLVGSRPLTVSVTQNPDSDGGAYSALQVIATRRAGRRGGTQLVVVNRDPTRAVDARLGVPGAGCRSRATATTLDGATLSSYNTAADDTAVSTSTTHPVLCGRDPHYAFPAHSVTLLQLGRS